MPHSVDKKVCWVAKVPGGINPADFLTKILTPGEFKRQRDYFMLAGEYTKHKKPCKPMLEMVSCIEPDIRSSCPVAKALAMAKFMIE